MKYTITYGRENPGEYRAVHPDSRFVTVAQNHDIQAVVEYVESGWIESLRNTAFHDKGFVIMSCVGNYELVKAALLCLRCYASNKHCDVLIVDNAYTQLLKPRNHTKDFTIEDVSYHTIPRIFRGDVNAIKGNAQYWILQTLKMNYTSRLFVYTDNQIEIYHAGYNVLPVEAIDLEHCRTELGTGCYFGFSPRLALDHRGGLPNITAYAFDIVKAYKDCYGFVNFLDRYNAQISRLDFLCDRGRSRFVHNHGGQLLIRSIKTLEYLHFVKGIHGVSLLRILSC